MIPSSGRAFRGESPRDAGVVAALALVAVAVWKLRVLAPAFVEFDLLANVDLYTQLYPMSHRAAEWIRSGVLPLWNPFQSCGLPFAATGIYGVFYPLNFPYLIAPTALALELVAVLHLTIAGVATYAYGRVVGLERTAATLGGLVFMLSGYVMAQATWFPPSLAACVWLPVELLAVERIVRGQRFFCLLFALGVGMGFLAGWPEIWVYTWYAVVPYSAFRLVTVFRTSRQKAVWGGLSIALGSAMGLGLAAIQLLPEAELHGLGPRHIGELSLEKIVAFAFITPKAFLSSAVDSEPGVPRVAYLGLAALLMLPASVLVAPPRGRIRFFGVVGVTSAVIALTTYTPIFRIFLLVPGATWFRAIPRILFLYAFAFAMIAGHGLSIFIGAEGARRGRTRSLLAAALGAVTVLLMVAVTGVWARLELAVGLGLCLSLLYVETPRSRNAAALGIVLLAGVDLSRAVKNPYLHPYQNEAVFDEEASLLAYVKEHQGYDRTYIHNVWDLPRMMAKQGTLRGIYSVTDYEPLSLSRYLHVLSIMDMSTGPTTELKTFTGNLDTDPRAENFRMLGLLSTKYVVAAHPEDAYRRGLLEKGYTVAFGSDASDYLVYQAPSFLPRAFLAPRALRVENERASLETIAGPHFDARSLVVLEAPDAPSPDVLSNEAAVPQETGGSAEIAQYAPTRVVVATESAAPAWLVLTDTHYPGWFADVDGVSSPIFRADSLFRCVFVAPGKHRVTFRYEPPSFRVGAAVTLFTALAMAAYYAARRVARVRS